MPPDRGSGLSFGSVAPATHRRGTWLFVRLLGLVYVSAFASFGVQARALVGEQGIEPYAPLLSWLFDELGASAYWRAPTVLWLWPTDGALIAVCVAGVIAGLLL